MKIVKRKFWEGFLPKIKTGKILKADIRYPCPTYHYEGARVAEPV